MADLLARRQAARQTTVEAGGHSFTLRRPTAWERTQMDGVNQMELICRFVVDWNLTEIDLVPGGDPVPAAFDAALMADYLADHKELWTPLTSALREMVLAHEAALEAAAKN